MADYRLPMDADGMKYHGTVDQNEENPGQFMYGLDENGNKRIIRTDEQGNVLTRVTGSNVEDGIPVKQMSVPIKVKEVNADSTTAVAPGGVKVVEVRPPKGVVWRTPLVWVWARAITDGTEGTQTIELLHGINSFHYLVLRAVSEYPDNCRIMSNIAESATKSSLPNDVTVQQNAIQSLILTNDKPLYVSYRNDSDGNQSRTVQVRLIVTEERVSE